MSTPSPDAMPPAAPLPAPAVRPVPEALTSSLLQGPGTKLHAALRAVPTPLGALVALDLVHPDATDLWQVFAGGAVRVAPGLRAQDEMFWEVVSARTPRAPSWLLGARLVERLVFARHDPFPGRGPTRKPSWPCWSLAVDDLYGRPLLTLLGEGPVRLDPRRSPDEVADAFVRRMAALALAAPLVD